MNAYPCPSGTANLIAQTGDSKAMEDNPILNSPYSEPRWHYSTDLSGQLNYEDIRPGRRIFDPALGGYSMPVGKQKQGSLLEVNEFQAEYGKHLINLTREQVRKWREQELSCPLRAVPKISRESTIL